MDVRRALSARPNNVSDFTRSRPNVVAFITSLVIGFMGCGAVLWYGRRRPVGAALSWGEAMAAATFAFLMFFWWYGVIPHQWIDWADRELVWSKSKFLVQSGQDIFGQQWLNWWPMDITMEAVRDVIVVVIYGLGLTLHIALWALWQDRAKQRPVEIPASRYGRPLVRKG
jgi:hypothetical protein